MTFLDKSKRAHAIFGLTCIVDGMPDPYFLTLPLVGVLISCGSGVPGPHSGV
jgi:hypothetical protein